MPISPETEQRMKQIEDEPAHEPENVVEPGQGWQCPVCSSVYDREGTCPVDQTLLTEIENWSEAAPAASEDTTAE